MTLNDLKTSFRHLEVKCSIVFWHQTAVINYDYYGALQAGIWSDAGIERLVTLVAKELMYTVPWSIKRATFYFCDYYGKSGSNLG